MGSLVKDFLTKPIADVALASQQKSLDVVVVGGGSAGITAARTLAEKGKLAAIIESGPLDLLTHIQSTSLRFDPNLVHNVQSGYQYSPALAGGGNFGSLIACVGGRGLFWNGAAPRFNAFDFLSWPFGYSELEEAYLWAEEQFRVTRGYGNGELFNKVCNRLKQNGIQAEPGPYAVDNHLTADGWLAGTVGNSLSPLLQTGLLESSSKNLVLSTKSFVTEVMVINNQAKGVRVMDLESGSTYCVYSKAVVLAAGAFESVRLALASNIPDSNGIVGRYITDHLFVRAYYPIIDDLYNPDRPEIAIAWVPATQNQDYQLEIHLPSDNLFQLQNTTVWKPDSSAYYAAMVRSFAPVQPRRDNYIECLAGNKPGSFCVHFGLNGDDIALQKAQVSALEDVRVSLGAGKAQVQVMPIGSSHHEAGGLAIGNNPDNSVADACGHIRGVEGLYTFDSSAWPDVSPANPHLTIVAIARRQALILANKI